MNLYAAAMDPAKDTARRTAEVISDGMPTYRGFAKASVAAEHFDEELTRRLGSSFVEDRAALARDPECPVDFMTMLSKDCTAVRQALARNPALPVRFQMRLAREGGAVGLALLENPTWPSRCSRS